MIIICLAVLGLCLGSFINAFVWRLHENQKKAKKLSILNGRSMCPSCRHQLKAIDLIPVLSWVILRGRCRYCKQKISWHYPLNEALTAALFVFSYLYWPKGFSTEQIVIFSLWLFILVLLTALALYDLKWFILPNKLVYGLIGLALIQTALLTIFKQELNVIANAFWGALIGGGIFYVLFQISGGKWIGGGDVKLGAAAGIIVSGPFNAMLMIFIASLLGTLVSVPLMMAGKAKRSTKLPFGPFLIAGTIIVYIFGASLVSWYKLHVLMI